jgi:hypothetical protein
MQQNLKQVINGQAVSIVVRVASPSLTASWQALRKSSIRKTPPSLSVVPLWR